MKTLKDLLESVNDLAVFASAVIEEARRITLEGHSRVPEIGLRITRVIDAAVALGVDGPVVLIDEVSVVRDDLTDALEDGGTWRIVLAKTPLAAKLRARNDEDTVLFFSLEGFHEWWATLDPFAHPSGAEPDFCRPTTIRVHGLTEGIGGPYLWVLPLEAIAPALSLYSIPSSLDVQRLIHLSTTDSSLRICPDGFALTWGVRDCAVLVPLMRISALVLSACLVQELRFVGGEYKIALRGAKHISLSLAQPMENVTCITLKSLVEAVIWVYEERPETRLRLIMDRLSIDSDPGDTFLASLANNLTEALRQARDSYAFVILERKDAYYKEMRELMKDMKSQADLYAAKVRDLVASLTRDILGVLFFIGFSFIGKFDQKNLMTLLGSEELSLLLKFLAGYLVLSCALQIVANWRDAKLSYAESESWLEVLQNYTSRKERRESFLRLLQKRRITLLVAMWIVCVVYGFLSIVIWNLPSFVRFFLV
ncbi:hypothetical protein [Thiocapsa roseopersicina]|uniref:Uncharacterized protein n=1 Tax=Thiocapsa roseopersicina TaxID=1058 RepID=A0A1H2QJY8_THIRO|nr:hypothetical protein [Thiocapsa roseopersicina]SDW07395.1 hypothetical protein SAMN05421783_101306 [Thiocapsa roseopersicina]